MAPALATLTGCLLVVGLGLSACVTTSYTSYEERDARQEASPAEAAFGRTVAFRLDDAIYAEPPECVALLANPELAGTPFAEMVEGALARHLAAKVPRVFDALERRRAEHRLLLDLGDARDRDYFARATGCRAFVRWRTLEASSDFALVWSRRRVGLEVEMVRQADERVLWMASHVASRSDGGLPLSAVSVAYNAIEAARFRNDDDILPSMIDDVVRRIFVTFPDLR